VRLAVLSDVHANLPALEAVLEVLRGESPDAYLCAGDVVGYGPFPNECIEVLSSLRDLSCVAGNHDLIAIGDLTDERCIPLARETLAWTRGVLTDPSRGFLRSLPPRLEIGGVVVAHGSLDDPQRYVRTTAEVRDELERLDGHGADGRILVLGHTHFAGVWSSSGRRVPVARGGFLPLSPTGRSLVNPGSVGQSREWRVHARCTVVDTDRMVVREYRVGYDTRRCAAELRRVGLPARTFHLPPWRPERARGAARRLLRLVQPTR
jgi:predicted phosphodiesterase